MAAALPPGVQVLYPMTETEPNPGVAASEMEKGPQKLRVSEQRVMAEQAITFYFPTWAVMNAFDDWYLHIIKKIGWFDYYDPRKRVMRTARLKGGSRGEIKPLAPRFARSARTCTVEFLP